MSKVEFAHQKKCWNGNFCLLCFEVIIWEAQLSYKVFIITLPEVTCIFCYPRERYLSYNKVRFKSLKNSSYFLEKATVIRLINPSLTIFIFRRLSSRLWTLFDSVRYLSKPAYPPWTKTQPGIISFIPCSNNYRLLIHLASVL